MAVELEEVEDILILPLKEKVDVLDGRLTEAVALAQQGVSTVQQEVANLRASVAQCQASQQQAIGEMGNQLGKVTQLEDEVARVNKWLNGFIGDDEGSQLSEMKLADKLDSALVAYVKRDALTSEMQTLSKEMGTLREWLECFLGVEDTRELPRVILRDTLEEFESRLLKECDKRLSTAQDENRSTSEKIESGANKLKVRFCEFAGIGDLGSKELTLRGELASLQQEIEGKLDAYVTQEQLQAKVGECMKQAPKVSGQKSSSGKLSWFPFLSKSSSDKDADPDSQTKDSEELQDQVKFQDDWTAFLAERDKERADSVQMQKSIDELQQKQAKLEKMYEDLMKALEMKGVHLDSSSAQHVVEALPAEVSLPQAVELSAAPACASGEGTSDLWGSERRSSSDAQHAVQPLGQLEVSGMAEGEVGSPCEVAP